MKNFLSTCAENLTAYLKQIRVERAVLAIVAGLFMLFSTACSNVNPPAPYSSGEGSYHEKVGANQPTELYDQIQPREGGMNQFSDTDPRYKTDRLGQRIERRVDKAEGNLDRSINSPGDYARNYREGTPLDQRVRNITGNVGEAAKNVTEDVSEGAQRGTQNLKVNTGRAERNAKEAVEGVSDNVKSTGRDVARKAGNVLNDAGEYTQDTARETGTKVINRS